MRSVGAVLTWQFLKRDGWLVLLAWANYLFWIPLLVQSNPAFAAERSYRLIHVFVFWTQVLVSASAASLVFSDRDSKRSGFHHRLYQLPVSTWRLVTWQMGLAAGSAALLYVVCTLLSNRWLGVKSPLWEPTLAIAVCVAVSLALVWSLAEFRLLRTAAFLAAIVGMAYLYVSWDFLWLAFERTHARSSYSAGGLLSYAHARTVRRAASLLAAVLGLAAAHSWALAAVRADRRGDRLRPVRPLEWLGNLDGRGSAAEDAKPFASPARAQYDYEWSRKGFIMPSVAGAVYLVVILCSFLFQARAGDTIEIVAGIMALALSLGALANGLALGHTRPFNRDIRIGVFMGTRPVPDRFLSTAVLKAAAASWLATFLVSVAALLLCALPLVVQGPSRREEFLAALGLFAYSGRMWWPVVVACGAAFVGLGLSGLGASLMLAGRQKLMSRLGFGFLVLYFALLGSSDYLEKRPWGQVVLIAILLAIGAGCLFVSVRAFVVAFRRGHIGSRTILAAAGVWLFLLCLAPAFVLEALGTNGLETVAASTLFAGFASLVPAPLAFAPLALAWNRHR